MPKISEAIINYRIHEDGEERLGSAEVTLPEIANLTQEIQGAGIAGTMESTILGHIEAMSLTLNFRTFEKSVAVLHEPGQHKIDIRVAQQTYNTTSRRVEINQVKYVLIIESKKLAPGKVAPAATGDASGEYIVRYYACYIDGEKIFEVDPASYIYIVNGIDYMKDVRTALGI